MRKQFIETSSRKQSIKLAPWASTIIKVDGGYMAFESETDADIFKDQK